jgi:hypothetical protein
MRIISPSSLFTGLTALCASISAIQAKGALGIKGGKVTVLTGGVEDASYRYVPSSNRGWYRSWSASLLDGMRCRTTWQVRDEATQRRCRIVVRI